MKNSTRVFLVLLRLAIGWHLLVEGLDKVRSVDLGPTSTNKPWSSRGYLLESTGPLAPYFRQMAGDPDQLALTKLATPSPGATDRSALPAAVHAEWDKYLEQFAKHYGLTDAQRQQAQAVLDKHKDDAGRWLNAGTKEVTRTYEFGPFTVKQTTPERIDDYRNRLSELHEALHKEIPAFNQDVLHARLTTFKAEVGRLRTELLKDLDGHFVLAKSELATLLTPEQKNLPALEIDDRPWTLIAADVTVSYGLVVVGAGLLLGLFTRTACVCGAVFLLLFYLAMMPLPGVPDNPRLEGHYVFVNKNLIEMLALLVLSTVPSGRWVGLDGLLAMMRRKRNGSSV
jgi:uncharacterized membrane protein YphA (DoxX/SURF4 family)